MKYFCIGQSYTMTKILEDYGLHRRVIYPTRSHGWSTTRIKDLITRQTIKQNPAIVRDYKK